MTLPENKRADLRGIAVRTDVPRSVAARGPVINPAAVAPSSDEAHYAGRSEYPSAPALPLAADDLSVVPVGQSAFTPPPGANDASDPWRSPPSKTSPFCKADSSFGPVNKQAVAAAFGRAVQGYDRFANLQRYAGERLLAHLGSHVMPRVLDAGCGTGWFSRRWRDAGSDVTALDLSPAMLDYARTRGAAERYVLGDIDALPLADAGFDLAWSNLAVQWCSQLAHGLAELYRVTRPGGYVAFSTLGQDSLHELHRAWRAVDTRAHANRFLTHGAIAAACPGARYVLHNETITLHFSDALSAMRSLKGIGATHLHHGRDGMLTRTKLAKLNAAWPRDADGLMLSYQLVFGLIRRD